MCGLIKRDTLDNIDIGFALLPVYEGKGYGYEAASIILKHAKNVLRIKRIVAITTKTNINSITLLKKLDLKFEKLRVAPLAFHRLQRLEEIDVRIAEGLDAFVGEATREPRQHQTGAVDARLDNDALYPFVASDEFQLQFLAVFVAEFFNRDGFGFHAVRRLRFRSCLRGTLTPGPLVILFSLTS